jgi:ribose transport system ATP-binding protein
VAENALELKGINKSFGPTQVLIDVDFSVRKGEIHALIGENGAGKSTLMNIAYGLVKPESGEIYVEGKLVDVKNAYVAQQNGICFVHQEIALCQDVTVAENIFMSEINKKGTLRVNFAGLKKRAAEILYPMSKDAIRPESIVESLSISQQQVVEIARALSIQCKVLILDEPTAALTESEAEALYAIMQQLKKEGIGVVFISHRMNELFEQCDRVTVLRDGRLISVNNVKDVTPASLVADMVGREIDNIYPPKAEKVEYSEDNVLLEVEDVTDYKGRFRDIEFKLYKGEMLGLSGLVGAGRSEVAQGIVGLRRLQRGKIKFCGKDITHKSSREVFDAGLVYLSENRKETGLFLEMSIKHNISSMFISNVSKNGVLSQKKEEKLANESVESLNIKCASIDQLISSLSGGNQQKVLVGKVLAVTPKVVIMDEPTRGIDVGAKAEIHKILRELVSRGIGVIMISSEMNEIVGMCDRVLIMNEGRICGEVGGAEIEGKNIMHYASGASQYQTICG